MIIPAFSLAQDDEFVVVTIHAPHVKVQDVDFYVEGSEFKFTLHPYFLRLVFPGELVEDGREHAEYRIDSGDVVVRLPKAHRGEQFADLDLMASVQRRPPPDARVGRPLIEVLASEDGAADDGIRFSRALDPDFHWELPADEFRAAGDALLGRHGYGFDGGHGGFLGGLQRDMRDIIDLEDPEALSPAERRAVRRAGEDAAFDEEHYMADYVCDDEVRRLLAFESKAERQLRKCATEAAGGARVQVRLSDEDVAEVQRLPRKEYLLTNERGVYLGLVDVLFAHAYDHRTTEGEPTVESPWTIAKVSPTLSHLEVFDDLRDVAVACVRRALCFPLYRHYGLAIRTLGDVACALRLGRRGVLQRLLAVRRILAQDECKRVLCSIYLDDYCVWVQGAREETLEALAGALDGLCASLSPADIGWDLDVLEAAAREASQEGAVDGERMEP